MGCCRPTFLNSSAFRFALYADSSAASIASLNPQFGHSNAEKCTNQHQAVQGVGEPRDTALWLQRWRKASEERWVKLMSKSVYSFAVGRPCQMQRQGDGEAAAEVCRGGVEGHRHQFRDWLALSQPRR